MTTITRNVRATRRSATAAVRERLRTLSQQLRDATQEPLSAKTLHDLRIACRRAEAALRLCRDAADSRAWRWLRKHLQALRRACNAARDVDVLRAWIKQRPSSAAKRWSRELQAHRKSLQPAIVKMATRLTDGRHFDQHATKVIRHLRDFERSGRASFVFGRRLFSEVHCFVKALPTDRDDLASLHQLRIVGKHLRYASEIVSDVWPNIQLAELREHLQTLQERLGAIHDQQVGRQLLKTFSSKQSDRSDRSLLRKMSDASDRDLRRFWRWWRSCPLERMLADTTAEVLTLMRRAVENQDEPRRTKKQTHR